MAINSLAYVLGGGIGKRLLPLTRDRAKPAVPFAGRRIVDFVLSNLKHSGIRKVVVSTQYQTRSLHNHINFRYLQEFGFSEDGFIELLPPQQGPGREWYYGTANAVNQEREFIERENSSLDLVNIAAADHIYYMDYSQMNQAHLNKDASLTICALPVLKSVAANSYGVLEIDNNGRVIGFEEKPSDPKPIPGNEDYCLASMGIYAFHPGALLFHLREDSDKTRTIDQRLLNEQPDKYTQNDFGKDILPSMLREGRPIYVYDFTKNKVKGALERERGYWKDVGNIDAYFDANMELAVPDPVLNLSNRHWPLLTYTDPKIPINSKTVEGGIALESIVCPGVIVSRSTVERSVVGPDVYVDHGARITESVLLGSSKIGKNSTIYKTIIDKDVIVPDNSSIGLDSIEDAEKRGFTVSENGVTVVPKGYKF